MRDFFFIYSNKTELTCYEYIINVCIKDDGYKSRKQFKAYSKYKENDCVQVNDFVRSFNFSFSFILFCKTSQGPKVLNYDY